MKVLRSRKVPSPHRPSPPPPKALIPPAAPPTPAQSRDRCAAFSSSPTTPLDFPSGSGSSAPASSGRRRSSRLAAQSGLPGALSIDSLPNGRVRKSTETRKSGEKMKFVLDLNEKPVESGSSEGSPRDEDPSNVAHAVPLEPGVGEAGREGSSLNSWSGRRVLKRGIEVIDVSGSTDEGEDEETNEEVDLDNSKGKLIDKSSSSGEKRRRYSQIEKGKAVWVSEEHQTMDLINSLSVNEGQIEEEKRNRMLKMGDRHEANGEGLQARPILIEDLEEEDEVLFVAEQLMLIGEKWEQGEPPGPASPDMDFAGDEFIEPLQRYYAVENKERFLKSAKYFASKHARFNHSEEGQGLSPAITKADQAIEDWPGPFSTAMKIIKDRQEKLNSRQANSASSRCKLGPTVEWTPRNKSDSVPSGKSAPSLVHLCITALCKFAEHISSLDCVPEVFRTKLSQMLCDSGMMNSHLLRLFVSGCPSEVCVKNCSAITEEELKEIIGICNFNKLEVLHLDLSGRCISDYLLRDTLAGTPNKLPSLISISLKCAYRLTDSGIRALVTAAPSLRSINFAGCSLITSAGIAAVAINLGSVLKEMYLDDCQGIDAMSVLPTLKKLKCLEVLSVARIQTVSDDFVHELLSSWGSHMKKLDFAGCRNLTDTSLATIADKCKGLLSLNLASLQKLTDASLLYIGNGCCDLQVLKLRQNSFSDEAVAAFVEVSGRNLREFSLNGVKQVANNTALAIASYCSSSLKELDLSWCHKLNDEALGFIVDKCVSLRLLKVFGCSQVTNVFLDGHSNFHVKIIGTKLSPITEVLDMAEYLSPY